MRPDRKLLASAATPLSWPLKKMMAWALEHPRLLKTLTQLISKFPRVFNPLLSFAQSHGIVMAPEDPGIEQNQIQSIGELSASARPIYEALQQAFADKQRHSA